ncbi:oxidoreductase [Amphritea opalescens]|uniref:Oxidoreductase n=1 Tax=Amphritea opalescens TaxID=2490544 RepID=A0A430KMW0_9GAMM|nr:PDR/VanB family oxidoreductase [Amphritea opalescens]RTE64829.1 oxidoreductase [Amphritea opalescens]
MSEPLIDVVISQREEQGEAVAVFELKAKDGSPLPAFDAGSHIDVHVSPEMVRQYSLSNDPRQHDAYRLGILNDPNSRGGSLAIHHDFKVGKTVQISAPRNHFPLDLSAERSVLVGGGIGITPMLTMAYTLRDAGKAFELHYCCRTRSSAAFLDELASEFAENVQLHFDDEADEQRFDPIKALAPVADTHVYVCGPSGFMDWVIGSAETAGYDKHNVHFEYFNADIDTSGTAFEVVAQQSGVTVMVGEDQTIVEALSAAGIKVDVSCEQGVCGTCLCDVLEGIPDHKDKFLTEEEREDNDQIILCCSRSKSKKLVLDI